MERMELMQTASPVRPNHARHRRRAVMSGALAALAAPFVRSAAAQQQAAALTPQLAELYEKAKPEGEVSIWAPGSASVEWIPAEFAKRFPAVKVKWLGDQQASSRLIAESRAGRHTADVWTFSLGGTLEVQKRGLLQKVDWRQYGASEKDLFFDSEAVATHNVIFVPVFSKSRLSREQVPGQWKEMLDPAWTDKLVSGTFMLPRLGGYLAIEWGFDEAERWIRTLINQRKMLVTTAPVANFLRSGEREMTVAESTSGAFLMNRDGLNVGYRLMDIVPASQFVLGVIKNAPRPNAARLLIAWLLTPEAKTLIEQVAGQSDIRGNSVSPLARDIKAAGLKVIFEDEETMNLRAEYYRKLVSLVRGQG